MDVEANPYVAPKAPPVRRTLRNSQIQMLRAYQHYRDRELGFWELMRGRWVDLLKNLAFFGGLAAVAIYLDAIEWACLSIGLWIGCTLQDVIQITTMSEVWPVLNRVLDYTRIQQELDGTVH